jgi:hypothetical protein
MWNFKNTMGSGEFESASDVLTHWRAEARRTPLSGHRTGMVLHPDARLGSGTTHSNDACFQHRCNHGHFFLAPASP